MIKIYVGNVGSGKTIHAVMDIEKFRRNTYSNIQTRQLKNCHQISPANIIIKEQIGEKKQTHEPIWKYSLNVQFWKDALKPCDVVLDEAHSILNSRRSFQS